MSWQVKTSTRTQSWTSSEVLVKTISTQNSDPKVAGADSAPAWCLSNALYSQNHRFSWKRPLRSLGPTLTQHFQGHFPPNCQVTTPPQQWHPVAFSLWGSFPHFHSSVTFSWVLPLGRLFMPKNINIRLFKVKVWGHRRGREYKCVSRWNPVIWLPKQVNSFTICSWFQTFEFHPRQINSLKR